MGIGTVFVDKGCQAVRLPAEMQLPDGVHQVSIRARGNELIVATIGHAWDSFFLAGPQVSDDFLHERAGQMQPLREAL